MAGHDIFAFDDTERARTLDFARRLRKVRFQALLVLLPVVAFGVVTYGWDILAPVALLLIAFGGLGAAAGRIARPELALVGMLLAAQVAIVLWLALANQYRLDQLGLFILPATAACILLPKRLMVLSTLWSAVVMVATAVALEPHTVSAQPPILFLPLGVMLCVALPASMIRQLEIDSRDTAMIDTLTGALNRLALETRIAELTAQAHVLPLRVGVIMGDLDRFKLVNDELGHDAGDLVLRETVRRMRRVLGPLTPVYRVGGEEFAVLMAGAEEEDVAAVAERLREAVRDETIGDRDVTMSFGIAAGTLDAHPVGRILEVADEALYRAKRAGRDRVAAANLTPMSVVRERAGDGIGRAAGAPEASSVPGGTEPTEVYVAPVAVALGSDRGNWMVRGDFERDHIRESARALSTTHHGALGFTLLALVASIPWIGWHLMVPAAFTTVAYHLTERRIDRIRRPEFALSGAWLLVQLSILAGAVIADPGEPYMLVLFTPLMIGMTAVLPTRGVVMNSAITVALIVAGAVLARPDLFHAANFGLAGAPVLIVIGIALMSSVTGRSAIEHRTLAVVDPLTGLLTRAALQSRLVEIGHESQVEGARVSLIAFDVDDFKGINDTHGHAVGDDVLRVVGAATRAQLSALEWAFRLGGDEFVVVVPSGPDAAAALAERLRTALGASAVQGVHFTGSFGVAATAVGEAFDYEALARRADAALYDAKRAGRDRVVVAPLPAAAAEGALRVVA
ncbi:MAG: diguanylate cyclase [Solirubrobacteraceae bacterium]